MLILKRRYCQLNNIKEERKMIVLSIFLALSMLFCLGTGLTMKPYFDIENSVFELMFDAGDGKLVASFVFWLLALIISIVVCIYKAKTMRRNYFGIMGATGVITLFVLLSSILAFAALGEAKDFGGWGLIIYPISHILIAIAYGIIIYFEFKKYKEAERVRMIRNKAKAQQRQQTTHVSNDHTDSTDTKMKNLELLKKYKELYDSGVLTEEEFNQKKKELL